MPHSAETIALLEAAGLTPEAIAATARIDGMLQVWRRRMVRRDLVHQALKDLGLEIDLAQLDVLGAIDAPEGMFDPAPTGEVMVATVADRLMIDPSRASRIVSEMVAAGYALRAVSQADARRTIIALTPRGKAVVEAVRAYKNLLMGDFLGQWPAEELERFLALLDQFNSWPQHTAAGRERFGAEIAALAKTVARAKADDAA
ncbi:MarR family transcriptional regulator [Arsenicitalea aurantiaca]|uniref:MarR family transcriptional regulator n=1 Tax=Arsenicitalea aurantiaca TaxID=1783274 RepID=A0A433X385_9HYPH|nr:MarR family winged helix-turn-helix transcriptional regulator [Arsenicitalea aurantiaca]RUT28519.1 MarR family transcriptional regulator [Arsenicitalea aurantiaca]